MRNKKSAVIGAMFLSLLGTLPMQAHAFSLSGLFGASTTNGTFINTTSTAVGKTNLNLCPVAFSGGTLPLLPCGGAIPLQNQTINIGNLQIGPVPSSSSTYIVQDVAGSGWCSDGSVLAGTTFTLPGTSPSIILPPSYSATGYVSNAGSITPPFGSMLTVPPNTPVVLSLNTPGSVTLPTGGTFPVPPAAGIPGNPTYCTLPSWSSISVIGNGVVQFSDAAGCFNANPCLDQSACEVRSSCSDGTACVIGTSCSDGSDCPIQSTCSNGVSCNVGSMCNDGTTCSLKCSNGVACSAGSTCSNDGNSCGAACSTGTPSSCGSNLQIQAGATVTFVGQSTLPLTTTDVMVDTVTPINGSYSLNIDTPGGIMLPSGGTFIGPMNNDVYSVPQNGILTALGSRQVQMPADGGLFTYAPGIHAITIIATSVVTPTNASFPVDLSSGLLYSPQTSSNTCTQASPN